MLVTAFVQRPQAEPSHTRLRWQPRPPAAHWRAALAPRSAARSVAERQAQGWCAPSRAWRSSAFSSARAKSEEVRLCACGAGAALAPARRSASSRDDDDAHFTPPADPLASSSAAASCDAGAGLPRSSARCGPRLPSSRKSGSSSAASASRSTSAQVTLRYCLHEVAAKQHSTAKQKRWLRGRPGGRTKEHERHSACQPHLQVLGVPMEPSKRV